MSARDSQPDEDLTRRVYAYFIFRLRQPADAERLTRLTFERIREERNMGREPKGEAELPVFATARAVIADSPRARRAARVSPAAGENEHRRGLTHTVAMAIGRLQGRERDAIALRFGAELSIGEMAELLDRTPADVKQRLARGSRMLLQLGVLPKEGGPKSAAERARARRTKQGEGEQEQAER